ncbi:PREDICTED: protein NUCLEAR FUSION DEFECTIVE 6, chloroplastic/mitochondrial-like isoform X2 [Fragaria vesca subsp. vesca]|uniref:protein NUCLEAR FUSION DEFECTIVE 6, chloroplastic/mitochondrial-like isoform X2 n=1 Tax=Fragaria vesca subsp. vesca TaxID=101020 RepID=UPI0002C35D61|nr:PREDICTED: protein NUCLEAR FUSION DEFECTIVE 6, chloroplastic/mitochondrial-like isoform X2 [Fragaria vesca subsp. vesca]
MASFAARSMLRSAAARTTTLGSRVASAARPKPAAAPFSIPKQNNNPISHALFRSPVELSCCVESLLPYHSATASALLTSMLSVSQRSYGWTPQGNDDS